jgi:hypothetical protein
MAATQGGAMMWLFGMDLGSKGDERPPTLTLPHQGGGTLGPHKDGRTLPREVR